MLAAGAERAGRRVVCRLQQVLVLVLRHVPSYLRATSHRPFFDDDVMMFCESRVFV